MPGSLLLTAASIVGPLGGKALGICPARVKKLMISTNICGKKLADSGYKFHYTFEEAIEDWYRDNDNLYLRWFLLKIITFVVFEYRNIGEYKHLNNNGNGKWTEFK